MTAPDTSFLMAGSGHFCSWRDESLFRALTARNIGQL